jgi:hypothetical protein
MTDLDLNEQVQRLALLGDQLHYLESLNDSDLRETDRRLARIARFAEMLDTGGEMLATIESDVNWLLNVTSEQRNTIQSVYSTLAGAIAILRTLRDQRNDALQQLDQRPDWATVFDHYVEAIAAANDFPLPAARKLLYVLLSSDDDVLINDVVIGALPLAHLRSQIFGALSESEQPDNAH